MLFQKSYNIIYYYYSLKKNNIAYEDLANPIIFSIATFRKWDKKSKIFILDASPFKNEWGNYPEILNFEVVKNPISLKEKQKINETTSVGNSVKHYLLSKPKQVYNLVKNKIKEKECVVVVDADIFFLKNPFPLECKYKENFCIHAKNTGYYYFLKNKKNIKILKKWYEICEEAIENKNLQKEIIEITNKKFIQEEVVWEYFLKKYSSIKNIKNYSEYENFWFNYIYQEKHDLSKIKNIHLCIHFDNEKLCRQNKGLFCIYIKELKHYLKEVLNKNINQIVKNYENYESFSIREKEKIKTLLGLKNN